MCMEKPGEQAEDLEKLREEIARLEPQIELLEKFAVSLNQKNEVQRKKDLLEEKKKLFAALTQESKPDSI